MYAPSTQIGDVRTRWHVTDCCSFDVPLERARLLLPDALASANKIGGARRRMSIFDQCELTAEVIDVGDGSVRVDATVTFDASDRRLDALVMMTSSIVGIPLGVAWRQLSIREARGHAQATFDALWRTLRELTRSSAYR